jgi:aldose 1-epimerase
MKQLKGMMLSIGAAALMISACTGGQQAAQTTVSGLDPAKFDTTIQEKPVKLYVLKNESGMEVCITNYGGRIVSLVVPDKDGKPTDVVLGFDNIAQYADTLNSPSDYGSSVGRYANRIKEGKFSLNVETFQLKQNDNVNCLHGGGTT